MKGRGEEKKETDKGKRNRGGQRKEKKEEEEGKKSETF